MNLLTNLKSITQKKNKRVGRGIGSGVGGHTTGRGAKGDNVRGKGKLTFDGTKIKKSWLKRTRFLRGKHRTLPFSKPKILTLTMIDKYFSKNEVVNLKSIVEKISSVNLTQIKSGIKILSTGELTKALKFEGLKYTKKAKEKIIAQGGKID